MKILIAGFGSVGRRHMRNLLALGEKDILLYRTHQSTLPDEELQGFPVETDLQRALDHKPDAVIVSNPTALHLDVAIPAAEAGCHLFLEKPIASSTDRLEELKAALARGGGKVLVGFQFRFHPGLQKAAALLQEGIIGRLISIRAQWGEYLPNWHPWEDYRRSYTARAELGGGVVLTLCHPFDYLRWLAGEPRQVWGITRKSGSLEMDVEDSAEIGFEFASGATGSLHLDYLRRPPRHCLEIVGSEGVLLWNQNDDHALDVYRVDSSGWENLPVPVGFDRNDLFLNEMKHFLEVASGRDEPCCTLEDGEKALCLALAVLQSSRENRPVQL